MTATDARDSGGDYDTVGIGAPDLEQFGAVELADGELIVYDIDREEGWIQSSDWIGREFMA